MLFFIVIVEQDLYLYMFPVFISTLYWVNKWVNIFLIENNYQEDGSIKIPKVLQPYMGGKEKIEVRKWWFILCYSANN